MSQTRNLLLEGGTEKGEWTLRRKDGRYLPVEVSAKIMPDGRWQALVRDISERKRLEGELRRAQNGGTSDVLQLLIGRVEHVRYQIPRHEDLIQIQGAHKA